jgi:LysR family transcriptional regulator, positive regulator for ilvC
VDFDDLRYFEELAQTLHFARTARTVGMSASALTRRIKALEDQLGHELLLRDHRDVQLTEAGKRFRAFVRLHLEQWEQLQNELRNDSASPVGELKIACTVTACHTLLPNLLSEFRKLYPSITLRLITQDAARSLAQLEAGEVDLAVVPTEPEMSAGVMNIPIAHTELAFIAPAGSPLIEQSKSKRPSDLNELPFVAPVSGLEQSRLSAWLRRHHLSPSIVAEVRGNEGLISMVALGSGIALVPRLVLESSPLRARVVELSHLVPPPGYQISLCAKKSSLSRRVVALFWQHTATHSSVDSPR